MQPYTTNSLYCDKKVDTTKHETGFQLYFSDVFHWYQLFAVKTMWSLSHSARMLRFTRLLHIWSSFHSSRCCFKTWHARGVITISYRRLGLIRTCFFLENHIASTYLPSPYQLNSHAMNAFINSILYFLLPTINFRMLWILRRIYQQKYVSTTIT